MALQHIRDVCIDFCASTGVWQETLDPIDVVAGERRYDIAVPIGAQIHSITAAWFDRVPVQVIHTDSMFMVPEQVAEKFHGELEFLGNPTSLVYDPQAKVVAVNPVPSGSVAGALVIRAILKPTRSTTTVPNILVNEYEYAISQGAVARIARVPNKTFTDAAAASYSEREYLSAKSSARLRVNNSFVRSQTSIKMRPF
jgi:hypothetical protein